MATRAKEITFVVPGQVQPAAAAATRGRGAVSVTARPGEDVVVLTIANGPTLVLHPADARDLLRAQAPGATRSGAKADADEVTVSAQLGWPGLEAGATRGATRGWLGQAALSAFEVVTGLFKDPAAGIVAALATRKLDGAVDEGVYQLGPEPLPATLKGSGA